MNRNSTLDASLEQVLYEVKRVIVGQDALLERMVVALLARGHLLVEGVPGLAKTLAVKTLAQAVGGEFQRIQFTPDLVPADIVGTRVFNQKLGEFQVSLGPVFANLVLADEINRAREVQAPPRAFRAPGHISAETPPRPVHRDGDPESDRVRRHVSLPEAQVDDSSSRC
jgi:MoxR-like ATPase